MQFNFTKKEEEDFIKNLYDSCNEELKKIYDLQKENKDKLLQELAFILLLYKIKDNVMDLTVSEKNDINEKFEKFIVNFTNKQTTLSKSVITAILIKGIKDTFKFYNYDYSLKEVEKIVNTKHKGELYTTRIINNEQQIGDFLYSKISDFTDGNIDVNTIKDEIDKTYKQNKTNVLVLAETELNRSENQAFIKYAKANGIKKIVRNEILDSITCSVCEEIHGKIFDIDDCPDEIHPCCRGFNSPLYSEVVED
jgi:hypothetical protein